MKRLISILLIAGLLLAVGFAYPIRETGKNYPRAMVVDKLDRENDVVFCIDAVGMEWSFAEIDDWEVGDLVSTILYDNGTPEIHDDYFVEIRYGGWNFPIEYWEY